MRMVERSLGPYDDRLGPQLLSGLLAAVCAAYVVAHVSRRGDEEKRACADLPCVYRAGRGGSVVQRDAELVRGPRRTAVCRDWYTEVCRFKMF